MFTMADQDEDGRINYEEFLVMITPRKVTSNRHENIFFSRNDKIWLGLSFSDSAKQIFQDFEFTCWIN